MKLVAAVLVCAAACSTQDNLGNHVFGEARWSISLGSVGIERATAATVDPIGDVIVAGTCSGSVDFGSGATDCYGSFVTQRSSETGAEQWTARLPDARITKLARVGTNIYALGTRPTLDGLAEQFVAIFDQAGGLRSSSDFALAGIVASPVATFAPDGRVFTTGATASSTDMLATTDELDIFLAAHYADGTPAWTKTFAGAGRQVGQAITISPDGDLILLVESSDPFMVGTKRVDSPAWPAQLILRLTPGGDLLWAQPMTDVVQQVAITPSESVVIGGCPASGLLQPDGELGWSHDCKDPIATVDAVAVSDKGEIVLGGHHADAAGEDGELFLVAFDDDGYLISSARSIEHDEPSNSRIDAIAVEPTGEVVFVTTATHAFDFGNGLLPFAGEEDVIVAKLDSSTGRDGQVLLARTVP